MTVKQQPLKGMKDILPEQHRIFSDIIYKAKKIGNIYGFEEFSTPLLEKVEVFDRTLGQTSDIVSKEMYDFEDKGGRHICLRPEFTASVLRGFISSHLTQKLPQKFFSAGPVFRYDRPQAGRLRQFHQINYEYLGAIGPHTDAEIIELAISLLTELKILPFVKLQLNSLGCPQSRQNHNQALFEYFSRYVNDLSEDSQKRLEKNPLRILDSKSPKDQEISSGAPKIADYYSLESDRYFSKLRHYLNILGIEYEINPNLVRGLDYYCHTTFEFVTDKLGSQSAVLAGGRYDPLCKMLGGGDFPSIGFAGGIERIMLLANYQIEKPNCVSILPISDQEITEALRLTSIIRASNIKCELDSYGKINKRVNNAIENGAKFIIFIGADELLNKSYKIKDTENKTESVFDLMGLMKKLRENFPTSV